MTRSFGVSLPDDLADWLDAYRSGVPRSKILAVLVQGLRDLVEGEARVLEEVR